MRRFLKGLLPMMVVAACLSVVTAAPVRAKQSDKTSEVSVLKAKLHKSKSVVRFYNHTGRWTIHPFYKKCWLVPVQGQRKLCSKSRANLDWHGKRVVKITRRLLALATPDWPAHHNLWLCLHGTPSLGTEVGHEASSWDNNNTGNNGHWGGLQMTRHWMSLIPEYWHGIYIGGYANNLPQLQQELLAEKGYRDQDFSHAWLGGQWGQTVGPCWNYA